MRCFHMANVHIRQALRLCPSVPDLKKVKILASSLEEYQMDDRRLAEMGKGAHFRIKWAISRGAYVVCRNMDAAARHATQFTSFITNDKSWQTLKGRHGCLISLDVDNIVPALLAQLYNFLNEERVPSSIVKSWNGECDSLPIAMGGIGSTSIRLH